MLDDSADAGGAGVVDRSIVFTIILDADPGSGGDQGLSAAQQQSFLDSLSTASRVMYSSHGSFGKPIPEPETITLVALGLAALALAGRARTPS
jgi:PEP-CTERM motif